MTHEKLSSVKVRAFVYQKEHNTLHPMISSLTF